MFLFLKFSTVLSVFHISTVEMYLPTAPRTATLLLDASRFPSDPRNVNIANMIPYEDEERG
jgi:hypothetical protein